MIRIHKIVLGTAALAMLSTSATPAVAATMSAPVSAKNPGDVLQSTTDYHRRDRGARVDEIRSVTRADNGWQVQGRLNGNAREFSCTTSTGVVDTIRWNDGRNI